MRGEDRLRAHPDDEVPRLTWEEGYAIADVIAAARDFAEFGGLNRHNILVAALAHLDKQYETARLG
jgi:hypothetical protein